MTRHKYSDLGDTAHRMYSRGHSLEDIYGRLLVPMQTLKYWRRSRGWEDLPPETLAGKVLERIGFLIELPQKTPEQVQELGMLLDKAAAWQALSARESEPAPPTESIPREKEAKGSGGRRKRIKNDIGGVTPEQLDWVRGLLLRGVDVREIGQMRREKDSAKDLFVQKKIWRYLALWYDKRDLRNRFIIKSRQIGATYYFAWEALENAIRTGDNQIFLSASRDQSEVFRAYIVQFAGECLGIELSGKAIILSNGAELRFLATNSRTAQSYHGHLYLDEIFWIPKFPVLWKVASGMSAHKKWRRTLFSTPSAVSHEAYSLWSGENYNRGKSDNEKYEFDVSYSNLKKGELGPDGIWRHMVSVDDAERQGCDLFDIRALRTEYSEDDFANLFMCQFVDDARSVFPLSLLLNCAVESSEWTDYDEDSSRPFKNSPVALGYDPQRSQSGDDASLVLLAVPIKPMDKWRVLKRWRIKGKSFQDQAAMIHNICATHNVVHIGIDVSGMGWGVYELVTPFYPHAEAITYSIPTKTRLVVKALEVMQSGRLQFDSGDKGILHAFLMIRKTTSDAGHITYTASRSASTGHADVAWAIMHGLSYESMVTEGQETVVKFF